jgi:hypothetical protein
MNAYERLMQEAIPVRPDPTPGHTWTPEEQAQHRADLLAAIDSWTYDRDTRRPHLHLVDDAEAA